MLTHERLRELLDYDPETGVFRWRIGRPGSSAGAIAGCTYKKRPEGKQYLVIIVEGQRFQNAGRLAWFWMTGKMPEHEIDHKNCDPLDNRWANLRQATSSQNKMNRPMRRDNTSGYKGVFYIAEKGKCKWRCEIRAHRRVIQLGYFATSEEAAAAYELAAKRYHGEFARVA